MLTVGPCCANKKIDHETAHAGLGSNGGCTRSSFARLDGDQPEIFKRATLVWWLGTFFKHGRLSPIGIYLYSARQYRSSYLSQPGYSVSEMVFFVEFLDPKRMLIVLGIAVKVLRSPTTLRLPRRPLELTLRLVLCFFDVQLPLPLAP